MTYLFAQLTSDDVTREIARLQHGYYWLSWAMIVAWAIVVVYVLLLVGREKKLKREIASLKVMLEEKQK
ncbi:MAG: hypothetical protein ABSH45_02380 [Bryobacteraceae bacterium]|jgi:uncharacterized membrane protein YdfJ with MMPL/SSD domain